MLERKLRDFRKCVMCDHKKTQNLKLGKAKLCLFFFDQI